MTDLLRFEWRYHTRQISFVAAALLFFAFGFITTATGFGPDNIHINSPYSIAESIGLLSLVSVFVLAAFCANAVVRDREHQMEEIVFATPIEKLPFLAGRFAGSFLAALTAFSTCTLGMLAARFMPWLDSDRLGATNLLHYVWALAIIALPNLFFAAVVLFALSTITRSVLASYAGSVVLYVLYFVAAAMTNSPLMAASKPGADENTTVAALLDPFALSAFFEQTRHWTPELRNVRMIALTGHFLLNRLLWMAVACAALALVYRLFSFRVMKAASRGGQALLPVSSVLPTTKADRQECLSSTSFGVEAFLSASGLEIRAFIFTRPFLAMLLLWTGLAAFEIVADMTGGEYGSASYPTAALIFGSLRQPLTLLAMILVIYTSAELVWRERTLRFAQILNATPATNGVFFASKCVALMAVVLVLTLAGFGAGAVIQLANGWPVEAGLLLAFAWICAAPLLLFAIAAIAIQTLGPQKYAGMMIVLLLALFVIAGPSIGLAHPLARFSATPPVSYSALSGFDGLLGFHLYTLFWSAVTALLVVLAVAAWRGTMRRVPRVFALIALIVIASGAWLFAKTDYTSRDERLTLRADYEKTYRAWAIRPMPRVRHVAASYALEPEARRYRVRGMYRLVNETAHPLPVFVVSARREAKASIAVATPADITHDARFNQWTVALRKPLAPGDALALSFDIAFSNGGIGDSDRSILPNGSYIMSTEALPRIGYRGGFEIDDPRERRKRGLPERTAVADVDVPPADRATLDLTISTAADQRVVAPGRLVREWQDGGRRFFRFATERAVPNQFSIASARYTVTRTNVDGVPIELLHHPSHGQNSERILRAARESLHLFTTIYGHPRQTIRIAEVPSHWSFGGFAGPGEIFLSESRLFLIDSRDPRRLDLVYRRVAHEMAHQWWGYTAVPADVAGASTITESITKYSELLALEKAYGRDAVRESLQRELDIYLRGRTSETDIEPPLTRAVDQSYIYYRKGAIVMFALKELLGEDAFHRALRDLLAEPQPTTAQLVRHLHAVAPPDAHALIEKWLNGVALYDLQLTSAVVKNGVVSMQVQSDVDEPIELGIFARDGKPLYLAKQPLRKGTQTIAVKVNGEAAMATIDPYVTRVDRNRFDNERRVE